MLPLAIRSAGATLADVQLSDHQAIDRTEEDRDNRIPYGTSDTFPMRVHHRQDTVRLIPNRARILGIGNYGNP
jgi:hypothetical protein